MRLWHQLLDLNRQQLLAQIERRHRNLAHICAMIGSMNGTRGAILGRIRMLNRLILARPIAFALALLAVFTLPAHAARDGSTDRPGLDYRTFELSAPNPDLCESACKREQQCRSWTYSWPGAKGPKAMCALKTGVPPKRSDTCCISGVMSTLSPVTRTDDPQPQAPAQEPDKPASTAKTDVETAPLPAPVPSPKPGEARQPAANQPGNRLTVVPKPKPAVPQQQQEETARTEPLPAPLPEPQATEQTGGSDGEQQPLPPLKVAACRDYANRALEQNAENNSLRCGLSGSRWGFGYDAYFNYCAKSPASAYESARRTRDQELERCKSMLASRDRNDGDGIVMPEIDLGLEGMFGGGRREESFCRTFASQSVRQVQEARRLDCGFGGSRWSPSPIRQVRLCEDIGPRAATQLLNARSAQLDRCRAEAGGRGFADSDRGDCAGYAQESVRQARIARRLGCGFGGPRWTTSYSAHLRWCQTAPYGEVMAELRIRERFLDRCN